jgi:15-cis-phytoene synthase
MGSSLTRSYAYCERLARRHAGNFYPAFRVLPRGQRRAMCALYAFLRISDDLTDGPGDQEEKRLALSRWRRDLDRTIAGVYTHPLDAAFHDTLVAYRVPREYLDAVLDGVEMDLDAARYPTFGDLYRYCYRVASAVGLACIHIWGCSREDAKAYAEKMGIGFQLTNILRDLSEDAARGRVYLPQEDLERFGYTSEALSRGDKGDHFRELMRFEVARARSYYEAGWPLARLLPPAGRAVFLVMARTYLGLLNAIQSRNYDVFSSRVSLSPLHKAGLVLRALPVRLGLV